MYGVLRCAHTLLGSHNNPISKQEDISRITHIFTDEETEFRKVKLFSHVIWPVSSPAFCIFPAVPDNVCLMFSNKSLVYLVILSRNLNQIPAIDCEGLSGHHTVIKLCR